MLNFLYDFSSEIFCVQKRNNYLTVLIEVLDIAQVMFWSRVVVKRIAPLSLSSMDVIKGD
jgi:hypothetical protein